MKAPILFLPLSLILCLTASAQEIVPGETPGSIGSVPFGSSTLVTVRAMDGNVWLQQNLGSTEVGTSLGDTAAFGNLYQWGRWDDGHAARTSATANTSTLGFNNPLGLGTGSPLFFIGTPPADWWGGGNDTDSWEGSTASATSGIDPCAALGPMWHMPSAGDWVDVKTSEQIFHIVDAFSSNLKLVLAGSRNGESGIIMNPGTKGLYWTKMAAGFTAFDYSVVENDPFDISFRGDGLSVRCVNKNLHVDIQAPNELRGLKIYPNPSMGNVTIDQGEMSISQITIYGPDLRVIRSWKPDGQRSVFSLSDFPNGTYGIQIGSGSIVSWHTIVIVH